VAPAGRPSSGTKTTEALRDFCNAGGTLISIGHRPELAGSASNQPAFDRLMEDLFREDGPAVVLRPEELPDNVRDRHGADVKLANPNRRIFYTHRRRAGRDLYFIVNNSPEQVQLKPGVRAEGPYTLYRPLTGKTEKVGREPELTLRGYEGAFLVTECKH
jgi:hypothetical protein